VNCALVIVLPCYGALEIVGVIIIIIKTIEDRPAQPAYEMFGIKRRFQRCKV